MLARLVVQNYKILSSFDLEFNEGLNILVGNNEAGKSTVLEAIGLALTKRLNGRTVDADLSPYLFSKECVTAFLLDVKNGKAPSPPAILIELYLKDDPALEPLRGSMNSRKEDSPGVRLAARGESQLWPNRRSGISAQW